MKTLAIVGIIAGSITTLGVAATAAPAVLGPQFSNPVSGLFGSFGAYDQYKVHEVISSELRQDSRYCNGENEWAYSEWRKGENGSPYYVTQCYEKNPNRSDEDWERYIDLTTGRLKPKKMTEEEFMEKLRQPPTDDEIFECGYWDGVMIVLDLGGGTTRKQCYSKEEAEQHYEEEAEFIRMRENSEKCEEGDRNACRALGKVYYKRVCVNTENSSSCRTEIDLD